MQAGHKNVTPSTNERTNQRMNAFAARLVHKSRAGGELFTAQDQANDQYNYDTTTMHCLSLQPGQRRSISATIAS